MNRTIACIDLKSFYASCECVSRGLDPLVTPLVVCDKSRGGGSLILSTSPYARELGVPSVCRQRDIPLIKGMIYATPRMEFYMEMSAKIMALIMEFVSPEDMHIYSVDECFLDLTSYLSYYKKTGEEIINDIQKAIMDKYKVIATAGISYNMVMAKFALDLDGKKRKPHYRAVWTKDDIPNKLWKVSPITKIWGINSGYSKRLDKIGINTIKQLANTPVSILETHLGIMGKQLHDIANGIDDADLHEKYIPETTSFSSGQVLFRDYNKDEMKPIISETVDSLCQRLHTSNSLTAVASIAIAYSLSSNIPGFSVSRYFPLPTDSNDEIKKSLYDLYDKNVKDGPIRRIYLAFGDLKRRDYIQASLFNDFDQLEDERNLNITIEQIKNKHGNDKIVRATSALKESTYIERTKYIGGHKK